MIWLGMDQPEFKLREIGSHRKYSRVGPKAATARTFRDELRTVFKWLRHHLKRDGYSCFVIGDSILKGQRVRNDQLLVEAATENGFSLVTSIDRRLQDTKKAFNPKIGKIKKEHVVILKARSMSSQTLVCKVKPYIQPFERVLAVAELSSLAARHQSPRRTSPTRLSSQFARVFLHCN